MDIEKGANSRESKIKTDLPFLSSYQLTSGAAKRPEEIRGEVECRGCSHRAQQEIGDGQIGDEVVAEICPEGRRACERRENGEIRARANGAHQAVDDQDCRIAEVLPV